jgi:hypothetical protein
MKTLISALMLLLFFSGCGAFKAPDVPLNNKASAPSNSTISEVCSGDPIPSGTSGQVRVSMRKRGSDDKWAYWKAGTNCMTYEAAPQLVASDKWDMRVTKYFPVVGSNGGKTAEDEGAPTGKASFAAMPIGASVPTSAAQVQSLEFVDDRYEGLEFQGTKLAPEYQNPLLNEIGPGILKAYRMSDHTVELSQRIFILRAVDGASFYAVRFNYFSGAEKAAIFEWWKL